MKRRILPMTALALIACAAPALAQQKGDWTFGLGLHQVDPKSDNGTLAGLAASIGDSVRPTVTFEYFIRDNIGIEVLAALPFKHSISLDGLGEIGETKQLPPVISLQYHFTNSTAWKPFVGIGVNYTTFFEEDARGALAGSRIEIEDSWGLAAHIGVDYAISERGSLRVDARWIDINSDVKLDGVKIGEAEIDPLVLGVAYVHRF